MTDFDALWLAGLFAIFAAVTVWVEHYMFPDWYPAGYTVIFTYLEGSITVFVWGAAWAAVTGHVVAAVAFFFVGVGAGASICAAYRRDYVTERRRKAAEAAQVAHQAEEARQMAAFLADQEGDR